jgi:4-amino-4-deoxy-L-arabinose transferase-like glycosyltransferase
MAASPGGPTLNGAGTPALRPPAPLMRGILRDAGVPALAALAFLLAAGWNLSLPGLQYDECLAAAPAVNFVRGVENAEPMEIRPSVIRPFGHPLPLMVMPYIGPVKTLLHAPIFAVLGISTVTVRLLPLFSGVASLLLTWWICRRLWDWTVAALTVVLLALDPSWVYYLTRDVGPAALAVLFKLSAVAMGIRWWRSGRSWDLAATGFFLGLGVSHKVDFLWVVAGLAVPLALLAPRGLTERLRGRAVAAGLLATGAFLLGAAPVVAFNLVTGGETFRPLLERLLVTDRGGFLRELGRHLGIRLEQVGGLLNGDLVHRLFFAAPGPDGALARVVPALVAVSVLWLVAAFLIDRAKYRSGLRGGEEDDRALPRPAPRLGVAVVLYLAVILVVSCFSPTALGPHHLLTLYPGFQVAVAVAAVDLGRRFGALRRSRRRAEASAVGILAVVVTVTVGIVNLRAVASIDHRLRQTGGVGSWSDAIGRLAEELRARGEEVVVLDWGFTDNLIVLTEGELAMEPAYREIWRNPAGPEPFERHLRSRGLYLLHARQFTRYPELPELLRQWAEEHGLRPVTEARFHQRDGREVYRLVRPVPVAAGRGGGDQLGSPKSWKAAQWNG